MRSIIKKENYDQKNILSKYANFNLGNFNV